MPFLEYVAGGRPALNAGAPSAGTDEVQTLTIGGTPTGGTFKLSYQTVATAAIPWNATNATLLASIDSALEALANVGANGVTCAAGTLTAGIGTLTITFNNQVGKQLVDTLAVANNSLTGTSPTLAVAKTTPGVDATARNAAKGATLIDTTNGKAYINTGTQPASWTVIGAQT